MRQHMAWMETQFGEVNDRLDKVESSSQREQPFRAPNVERSERNPPRNDYEDDYGNDLEEDDRMSHVGTGRFGRGMGGKRDRYGNRGDRYGNRESRYRNRESRCKNRDRFGTFNNGGEQNSSSETIHVQDPNGHEVATHLKNVYTIGKGCPFPFFGLHPYTHKRKLIKKITEVIKLGLCYLLLRFGSYGTTTSSWFNPSVRAAPTSKALTPVSAGGSLATCTTTSAGASV
ncbi:hypothetical protein Dsin_001762 [Dipteronia sinensis]|uniref:Uncharacterized protein n=1 Tax=Dipteronia sinensis TaxID=43782 RepID=A0AAE0EIS1_9ROSI|nr:hypothetical protein Dsin_001762 [Dipteronia sinensis]